MKVLQVNVVYAQKSTGITCLEVEKALIRAGHECVTAYGIGEKPKTKNSYRISTRIEYIIHNVLGRITGLCGYFSIFATHRLIRFIKKYDPDIIHLRNLHAFYINLPMLFGFLKNFNKPVILNVHDCWIFTGKCTHYTVNKCEKYKTGCSNCTKNVIKQYPQSILFDFTRKMFNDKKKWLDSIKNLTVVGVSDWTATQAKSSFLGKREVLRIYNWIDTEKFFPKEEKVFSKYNIPDDKFTIVCAGVSWSENSLKFQELKKLVAETGDDVQYVIIGNVEKPLTKENVYQIGYISNSEELANIYSSADIYIHFSLEDTFGKVTAEALSCGTPAIVYNSTSSPEIVDETCGIIVEPHDLKGIISAINKIRENPEIYTVENCRKRVLNNFNYDTNVSQVIDLYNKLYLKEGN